MEKRPIPDWIEDYIEGKLEGERLKEAEEQLAGDAELRQFVAIGRELPRALGSVVALRRIAEDVVKAGRAPRKETWRKPIFIAAAIVSFVIVAILAGQFFQKPSSVEKAVFARYFNPEIAPSNLLRAIKTENTETDSLQLDSLAQFYIEKNYPEAIRILQTIRPKVEEKYLSNFNIELGKLYLLSGKTAEAVEALERVQVGYVNEKSWYLAMAALLDGDHREAATRLRAIAATEGHPYRKEAEKALEELKEEER
ncbi:MAG: hypothetical protein KF852_10105 [Saprospiraceae bacterium]|nr:hypothetical protein [Saprospiraceae bacterium]